MSNQSAENIETKSKRNIRTSLWYTEDGKPFNHWFTKEINYTCLKYVNKLLIFMMTKKIFEFSKNNQRLFKTLKH